MVAVVDAAIGAVLSSNIDGLGIFRVNRDGLDVRLGRQSVAQLPGPAVADRKAEDAAAGAAPSPSHSGIDIGLIGQDELLPSVSAARRALACSSRKAISSGVDSRPRIALRCGKRPNRSMTSMYGRP
jgi:hypothetical protein